jgi:hypothetical protein
MLKCSDLDYCLTIPDFFYADWKSGSCYSHRMKDLEQALRIIP